MKSEMLVSVFCAFLCTFSFSFSNESVRLRKSYVSVRSRDLHGHHSFLLDAYLDLKNVLVPRDVYSTVAIETANLFVRLFGRKHEPMSPAPFKYRTDSLLFISCFFLGIPQTFNPLLVSLVSIDGEKKFKKKAICAAVGISKWLIYNKLIALIGSGVDIVSSEELFITSGVIAAFCASTLKYVLNESLRTDTHGFDAEYFMKKEVAQIFVFENAKQALNGVYPLHTELLFSTLVDTLEKDTFLGSLF